MKAMLWFTSNILGFAFMICHGIDLFNNNKKYQTVIFAVWLKFDMIAVPLQNVS